MSKLQCSCKKYDLKEQITDELNGQMENAFRLRYDNDLRNFHVIMVHSGNIIGNILIILRVKSLLKGVARFCCAEVYNWSDGLCPRRG